MIVYEVTPKKKNHMYLFLVLGHETCYFVKNNIDFKCAKYTEIDITKRSFHRQHIYSVVQ